MIVEKRYIIFITIGITIAFFLSARDEISAIEIQKELHRAHHEKLKIIKQAGEGHFYKIVKCHNTIKELKNKAPEKNIASSEPVRSHECTTTQCKILRLTHEISSTIQALMKLMKNEQLERLKELDEQIHSLRTLLRQYGLDDKAFDMNPNMLYL